MESKDLLPCSLSDTLSSSAIHCKHQVQLQLRQKFRLNNQENTETKLRVFCKVFLARCTSLREKKGRVSKTEVFLRFWCARKCPDNSFCLLTAVFSTEQKWANRRCSEAVSSLASGPRADSLPWFDSPLVQGVSQLRNTDKVQYIQRPGRLGQMALEQKRHSKNEWKSPKNVKNWGFLAIFSCSKQPSAGIPLSSVKN